MPNPSKLKKNSNATKMFWFKVEVYYFQTATDIIMSLGMTNKSTNNCLFIRPFTEEMSCDGLLLTTICQSSSSSTKIFYHNANDFLQTVTSQSKYKLHHLPLEVFGM